VVVQVTPGGHSGIFTHTVGHGVTVVVVLVVVTVDDVLVDVLVEMVVRVKLVDIVDIVVTVRVRELTVNVNVLDVLVVDVLVVVVVDVGIGGTAGSLAYDSHITSRGKKRLRQMHQGMQAQNQGVGLGTGTVSNWPPCPTYFHSFTCSHWPLPPPTYTNAFCWSVHPRPTSVQPTSVHPTSGDLLHQLFMSQNAAGCENIGAYPGARYACDGDQPARLALCAQAGKAPGGPSMTTSRDSSLEPPPGCGMAGRYCRGCDRGLCPDPRPPFGGGGGCPAGGQIA